MFLLGIMEPDIGLRRMSQCLLNCKSDKDFFSSDVAKHIPIGKWHSFHCITENSCAAHRQLRHKIFHVGGRLGHWGALNKTAL